MGMLLRRVLLVWWDGYDEQVKNEDYIVGWWELIVVENWMVCWLEEQMVLMREVLIHEKLR